MESRTHLHFDEAGSDIPTICLDLSGFLAPALFPGVWIPTVDLFLLSLSGFDSMLIPLAVPFCWL